MAGKRNAEGQGQTLSSVVSHRTWPLVAYCNRLSLHFTVKSQIFVWYTHFRTFDLKLVRTNYSPFQKNWALRCIWLFSNVKIFQFSLFQCLKDAFVLLIFQFQVYFALGKQLSFFRAKINGFAFSPTSKRSLQVCVVHISFPRAARKGQSPTTLHCNCTGAMQRGRQQKPRYVQKRIPELFFFFVKADVLFWKRSSFVYLEESVRVPSFVPSSLRHRCRSWRLMFLKSVSRLPDYPTLKNDSH